MVGLAVLFVVVVLVIGGVSIGLDVTRTKEFRQTIDEEAWLNAEISSLRAEILSVREKIQALQLNRGRQ